MDAAISTHGRSLTSPGATLIIKSTQPTNHCLIIKKKKKKNFISKKKKRPTLFLLLPPHTRRGFRGGGGHSRPVPPLLTNFYKNAPPPPPPLFDSYPGCYRHTKPGSGLRSGATAPKTAEINRSCTVSIRLVTPNPHRAEGPGRATGTVFIESLWERFDPVPDAVVSTFSQSHSSKLWQQFL